jgi:hypothetical protein
VKDENFPVNSVWIKAYRWKKNVSGVFIRFSEPEKMLLHFLEENPSITLSRYCKITGLPRRNAENVLAGFLAIGMIGIIFSESGVSYCLSDTYAMMTPDQREKAVLSVSSNTHKNS